MTPSGAGVLLGCALLLAGGQLIFGTPVKPIPDLPVLAALAFAPLALATRLTKTPGAASAVCGAYLLPRTLLSLFVPALPPPPLLLVPALAFDVSLWLRVRGPRQPSPWRASLAAALFGLTLAIIEPAFLVLLGADRATWSGPDVNTAAGVCAATCAVLELTVRGRES